MNTRLRHTQLQATCHYLRAVVVCLVLCLTAQSCDKDSDLTPDTPTQDNEIRFHTGTSVTRGLIGDLALGSRIRLYGYHDDAFLAAGKAKELNGKILTYSTFDDTERWSVVDDSNAPITYFWEGDGTYRFYGWLEQDPDGLGAPTSKWNESYSDKKLTIDATLDKDYNQFDFLYSEVDERTLPTDGKGPVNIDMSHLFSAFGIGISNTSEDDITIKSVTLRTLHDKGTATIDFSSDTKVVYGGTSISRTPDTEPFMTYSGSYTVGKDGGEAYNIFKPAATAKEYYIVWPQAESVFPKLTFDNDEAEASEPDTSFPLILEYEADGKQFKKRMQLPKMAWEPGKLYYFNVLVADKLVEINATVRDWNYSHSDVDFGTSAVTVKEDGHLTWDETKCRADHTARKVYVKNGQPVEGTFTIDTPKGGQWRVSLEGDVTAFTIMDDTDPTDDGFGPIDGEQHRIRVVPQITNPDRDYSVTLKFVAITADSKTYPADDMVQDYDNDDKADKYTIVLERN